MKIKHDFKFNDNKTSFWIKVDGLAKYLGIWLDENLTKTKQLNNICRHG